MSLMKKEKVVSSGISKMVNICRTGEITGLLKSNMYCLALLLPPRNNIQAGRGYQLSGVGSPRQIATIFAWVSCTQYN